METEQASGTEARVIADIVARQKMGIRKYGTTVENNQLPLLAWLRHAYEESLDLPIYLRRSIEEIDKTNKEATASPDPAIVCSQCGKQIIAGEVLVVGDDIMGNPFFRSMQCVNAYKPDTLTAAKLQSIFGRWRTSTHQNSGVQSADPPPAP